MGDRIQRWAAAAASRLRAWGLVDRWLALALVLGGVLGVQGMGWGRYDCLNADSMAFRTIFSSDRPPGHPGNFSKPPFYTYVNHVVARLPAQALSWFVAPGGGPQRDDAYFRIRLILGRLFNLTLFAGATILVFALARTYYGIDSARVAALIFSTTAGYVVYQVFLTTDLALVFMMLAAFAAASAIVRNPSVGISVAAGLLAGLATATKYNGLAVAAALPVAHLLASRGNPIMACLRRPAAWLCGLAVPVGFLLGNPYAVLDWPKFSADFVYNYETTPVYGGVVEGTGYATFVERIPDLIGWPAVWFLAAGAVAAVFALRRGPSGDAWKLVVLAAAVAGLYFWRIGDFPRIATRFVLPVTPFLLLIAACGFGVLMRWRYATVPFVAVLVAYNVASGWWVGSLFREDPRMRLIPVLVEAADGPTLIEASKSIPYLHKLSGEKIRRIEMPGAIERGQIFSEIFEDRQDMEKFRGRWKADAGPEWFSASQRAKRNPDFVVWCENEVEAPVRSHFEELLSGEAGYHIIFDSQSPNRPWWAYPSRPEFVPNRTIVWQRNPPNPI
ncbi:MAG: glycosyltransferase family 39 protein [Terrimicrobiaceae bacterium]|nr:glycosyltransferase family 39 protein [Terrimicrobiaceae bacterium]